MRWLICIIPLFLLLACDNPLGPQPISGTFEGKNGAVFIEVKAQICQQT